METNSDVQKENETVVARRAAQMLGGYSRKAIRDYGIILAFLAVFTALSLMTPAFLTARNMLNVLDQASQVGLIALGATVAIIGGGFDLSAGAIFAIAGASAAIIAAAGFTIPGLIIGILLGLLLGALNGTVIAGLRVNSFVATLAAGLIIRGAAYILTDGLLVQVGDPYFAFLGRARIFGVKMPIYFFLGFALFTWILLSRTTLGRYIYALGGNEEAARFSGVRVRSIRTLTFAISGLSAGIAGVIHASRIATGQANVGQGLELSAIAAVVIGGTSIMGGEGAVWRTLLGVLLLQLVSNGFNILNVPPFYQVMFEGCVIMFAIVLDAFRHGRILR
ncbi:MAG: ABC transporter permease [Chloroflexota bacterium]